MTRIAWTLYAALGGGCLDPQLLYEVEVTGSVISGDPGPIEIWFLHNEWGEPPLATRYMIIDTTWLEGPTSFSQVLQVPQGTGSGLSVYGWQDRNGDAEHCRPGTEPELSGLVEVESYPSHVVEVEIPLDTPCEGPEGL